MKKILLVSMVMSVVGLSVLFASGGAEGKTVRIGVAGPYSGDLAAYGVPTSEAAQIIADRINAEGGIGGAQIKLMTEDDACDPAQATTVASKLASSDVLAVIGHICSGATISALGTYMSAGIPIISPSATAPALTKSGDYKGFYRTIAPDDLQGVTQANYLIDILGIKNVAVVHDSQDYGKGLADSVKATLEARGTAVPVYEGVTVGAVDYSAVVSKIISARVGAVAFGGYHPEGSKLIGQLRAKGFKGAFISGDGLKGQDFINLAGADAEGVYTSGPRDYTDNAEYKAALAEYKRIKSSDPGTFYFEGHAAVTVLLDAIAAGNTTSEDIAKYLSSGVKFKTAVGEIYFDKRGDAQGTGFDVYQVVNGDFVVK